MNEKTHRWILQMMVTALALIIGDWWIDGAYFAAPWMALVTALLIAFLNVFLKPLLIILTIPATILTFGIFLLVINACIILIASELIPNDYFVVEGFWPAFWLALIVSIANSLVSSRVQVIRGRQDLED